MKKKSIAFLIYTGVWLTIVLLQTLLLSSQGTNPSVWQEPNRYYSTWVVDLYLILLFYANYYFFAPKMIQQRLFRPYVGLSLFVALIGFLIPILLYSLKDWGMPGVEVGVMPFSSLGVMGAIAMMAIGLSLRSVLEWVKLDTQRKELAILQTDYQRLQGELEQLRAEKEALVASTQIQAESSLTQASASTDEVISE